MAQVNSTTTLNGLFKTVYAEKLLDLIPNFALLQRLVDFVPADKETGKYYSQPVVLAHEAGFTYLGNNISGNGYGTLNSAAAGAMSEAQVYGYEMNLRSQLSYTALTRAAEKGPRAFKRLSAFKVEDMNNAFRKRLELQCLYGQSGLATVSANSSGVLTITDASWSAGTWAGLEGATLEAWASNTQHNGDLVVSAVNTDAKTITVTGTNAAVVANDVLFFKGAKTASSFNEMLGLQGQLAVTGTVFGIDKAAYSLWAGNTVTGVGQISLAKIQDAIAKAVNKGLMEDVAVFVSPKAWGVLMSDQAALRVFDSSYKSAEAENGAEKLTFHSQNGKLTVYSHPLVKDGDAFVLPLDQVIRLGSEDMTFGRPGIDGEETVYFDRVPNTNALEVQAMCDQAIFLSKPAHGIFLTGITYAS